MTDLNLTPEEWEALAETLASERELDPDNYIATALDKVLAHRPKPALEGERDHALEATTERLRDFVPNGDHGLTGDLAVDMAAYAGRMKAERDALVAEVERLRASVRAGRAAALRDAVSDPAITDYLPPVWVGGARRFMRDRAEADERRRARGGGLMEMEPHVAWPGPDYWSWRCLACGEPVADHPSRLALAWRRLRSRLGLRPEGANRLADAWDAGFEAGHQAARAVNPEWPAPPANPYRVGGAS